MTAFLLFLGFGFMALVGALLVLLAKKLMHNAIGLLVSLLSVSGLFLLTGAEFVAVTQIMVYAGGIIVLIIFGLMLTSRKESTNGGTWNRFSGTILATILFGCFAYGIFKADFENQPHLIRGGILNRQMTAQSGFEGFSLNLLTQNLLAFEVAGVLLLVALIGAVSIAANTDKG